MSINCFKIIQSFLTVAVCIVIISGSGVIGHPVKVERNHKINPPFSNYEIQNNSSDLHQLQIPSTQNNNETQKRPRFLTSLFNQDAMKCAPQVMCELISANEPGPETDTLNDYKYLMKEFFLKRDSEEIEDAKNKKQSENYRSSTVLKSKSKQKIPKKKRKNAGSAGSSSEEESEEDSASLPSQEEKVVEEKVGDEKRNGLAQLMDLEEEDAIDNKAIDDMIHEDPDDFVFALADAREKHRLQQLALNRLNSKAATNKQRFNRNVRILEKSLARQKKSVFRTSRSFQNLILERKARELEKATDMMDRIRIAAEVGSMTRNGRQCRALFDTSSCTVNTQGIQGLVQNVKKAISGSAKSNSEAELVMQDLKTLLKEAQAQNTLNRNNENNVNAKSGPDVKIVLNIGGGPPQQIQGVGAGYQPQQSMLPYWPPTPISLTTTTTTVATKTIPPKIVKPGTRRPSNWPKLKNLKKSSDNSTIIKDGNGKIIVKSEGSLKDQELREQYKLKLQQAANLIRLPWGIPKNFTNTNKRKSTLKSTSSAADKKKTTQAKYGKFPKQSISINSLESSDSDSLESSEEEEDGEVGLGNVLNVLPMMQNNDLSFLHNPSWTPPTTQRFADSYLLNQNFYRGLSQSNHQVEPYPHRGVIASVPAFNTQQRHKKDFRQRATAAGSSLVSNVYDVFFRRVMPLPHNSSEWVPSALRHGRRSQIRNYQRFGESSRLPPNSGRMPAPHMTPATKRERPQPQVKSSKKYPTSSPQTTSKVKKKVAIKKQRKNKLKYKQCCSKSS